MAAGKSSDNSTISNVIVKWNESIIRQMNDNGNTSTRKENDRPSGNRKLLSGFKRKLNQQDHAAVLSETSMGEHEARQLLENYRKA